MITSNCVPFPFFLLDLILHSSNRITVLVSVCSSWPEEKFVSHKSSFPSGEKKKSAIKRNCYTSSNNKKIFFLYMKHIHITKYAITLLGVINTTCESSLMCQKYVCKQQNTRIVKLSSATNESPVIVSKILILQNNTKRLNLRMMSTILPAIISFFCRSSWKIRANEAKGLSLVPHRKCSSMVVNLVSS